MEFIERGPSKANDRRGHGGASAHISARATTGFETLASGSHLRCRSKASMAVPTGGRSGMRQWTSLRDSVRSCQRNQDWQEALRLLDTMQSRRMDQVSVCAAMSCCTRPGVLRVLSGAEKAYSLQHGPVHTGGLCDRVIVK